MTTSTDKINNESFLYDFFCTEEKERVIIRKCDIHQPFRLPITYVKKESLHSLSETVMDDLEYKTILSTILTPENEECNSFGDLIKKEWYQYSSDIHFLHDTQTILKSMKKDEKKKDSNHFFTIWDDVHDKHFLEKYYYMEWPQLIQFNKSAKFLQCISIANVLSPIISLFLPLFILLFPFLLLKLQGIPITMSLYFQVLKETARNHFIGKSMSSLESMSWDKIIYVIITLVIYILQIYQNTNTCIKYYHNVKNINNNLLFVKNYLKNTITKMDEFVLQHQSKITYQTFCQDVQKHSNQLKPFLEELSVITEFQHTFKKTSHVGYMLKCYHDILTNERYTDSIRYSIGFEGYLENMMSISQYLVEGKMNLATFTFDNSKKTSIQKQFYPINYNMETNNINMENNIIITGPNASGKTTLLKTTAINIILSQQFGCGFYSSCILQPYHHIHSYINIPDTSERDSLFQAESRRCKDILDTVNTFLKDRHFCIFDELYSGTNPIEAIKAGYAFLSYLTKYDNVDFMLTTHYIDICKKIHNENIKNIKNTKQIHNYKMKVDEKDGKLFYTYKMVKGISKIQGAVHVLKEMGYPEEIVDSLHTK